MIYVYKGTQSVLTETELFHRAQCLKPFEYLKVRKQDEPHITYLVWKSYHNTLRVRNNLKSSFTEEALHGLKLRMNTSEVNGYGWTYRSPSDTTKGIYEIIQEDNSQEVHTGTLKVILSMEDFNGL